MFLTQLPFPQNSGGKIRLEHLLQAVSEVADVHFVGCVNKDKPEDEEYRAAIQNLKQRCNKVTVLPCLEWWPEIDRTGFKALINQFVAQKSGFLYREFRAGPLFNEVRELADSADFIFAHLMHIGWHLKEVGQKQILDINDLESVKIKRELKGFSINLYKFARWIDWYKTRQDEKQAIHQFARLLVCSDQDKKFWHHSNENKVWTIPNGFNGEYLERPIPKSQANRAIFVGTLGYQPNIQAALIFARQALPLIRAKCPDFEFWIVGKNPVPVVRNLDNGDFIRVYPDVEDIADYVAASAVSVVPLHVGGGTRLKILESLGLGVPVVSTAIGIEGIDLKPDVHYLLAEKPAEFAEQVLKLLRNREIGIQQVIAAQEVLRQKYTWDVIRNQLTAKLKDFILEI